MFIIIIIFTLYLNNEVMMMSQAELDFTKAELDNLNDAVLKKVPANDCTAIRVHRYIDDTLNQWIETWPTTKTQMATELLMIGINQVMTQYGSWLGYLRAMGGTQVFRRKTEHFAKLIRKHREKKKLSYTQVAELLGLKEEEYRALEDGKRMAPRNLVKKIAELLEIPPHLLYL